MAENVTARVRAPREASAGEVVSVRTLISHPMESGMRRNG
ncbi:MAG: thiosulfate oxidation carrier complex protein SoxZ, partial [Proteobacteria bacterium]|nr:thiosulfate oxidation carrier complex protein SoxZ [Pseudomonadota bacterium]